MNKTSLILRASLILFLAVPMAACAPTPTRQSTGEFIDDATITTKVKAAIFEDPALKVFQINVETFKGDVQLSGFVDSVKAAEHAVGVASRVKGVQSVRNSLIVK
jgi:osmotically-inducible protein OsmY